MKLKLLKRATAVILTVAVFVSMFISTSISAFAAVIGDDVDLSQYGEYISNEELGDYVSYGGYITKSDYAKTLGSSVGASYRPSFEACQDTNGNIITVRTAMARQYVGETALMIAINGSRAYCIQPGIALNSSSSLTETTSSGAWANLSRNQQQAINTALCYGREGNYSAIIRNTSINSGQCYIATQLIIWEIVNGQRKATAPFSLNGNGYLAMYCSGGANENIKTAYNRIVNAMAGYQNVPSFADTRPSNAPTYTLNAVYNNVTKTWNYESVTLTDSNKVLSSSFMGFNNKTLNVGNATVTVKIDGDKLTLTPSNARLNTAQKSVSVSAEKTGVPTTNEAKLLAYTSTYQDVVSGGSIDPPSAFFNVQVAVHENAKLERDGRVQKIIGTQQEYDSTDEDVIDGSLSTAENLEGWYFQITVPESSIFHAQYGVTSFVLGPTDKSGFTQTISEYVMEHFDYKNVTSIVPYGNYYVTELGKKRGTTFYMPDFYRSITPEGRLYFPEGSQRLDGISYMTNLFDIPTQIFKTNEDGSSTANYHFQLTEKSTGKTYIIRSSGGAKQSAECISDTSINKQIGRVKYLMLPEGSYTMTELGLDDGNGGYYIPNRFDKPSDIDFEVSAEAYKTAQKDGLNAITINVENKCSGYIGVHKTDSEDPAINLEGAVYGVFSDETCLNLLHTLPATDTTGFAISDIRFPCGEDFYVKEIEAPPTHQLSDEVFTVRLTAENTEIISYTQDVSDYQTVTEITKLDLTGSKEISGALLNVAEADNLSNVIDEWRSTIEPHIIKGLVRGKSYVLTEKTPAPGYVTAEPVKFNVNEDGSTTTVTMRDAPTKMQFIKVDGNGNPLKGVELQVLEGTSGSNVVVPTWETDGNPYTVEGKLIVGNTYRLHEVKTLPGYKLADDIEFTVRDTDDIQTITMENVLYYGSVVVHKKESSGAGMGGSRWEIRDTYGDKITAYQYGAGRYTYSKTATNVVFSTDSIGNLSVNEIPTGDYVLVEVNPPSGYMPYGYEIPFTISANGTATLFYEFEVRDNRAVLNSTGSIGTTPFYCVGCTLSIVSILTIGIYFKKRKK